MATKLTAARIATASGCATAVLSAARPEAVRALIDGDRSTGTVFRALPAPARGRKRWIPAVPVKGSLALDSGAAAAVAAGKSLFAAGVTAVTGDFAAQDAVALVAAAGGPEFGRAIVNYSAAEVCKIKASEGGEGVGVGVRPAAPVRGRCCRLRARGLARGPVAAAPPGGGLRPVPCPGTTPQQRRRRPTPHPSTPPPLRACRRPTPRACWGTTAPTSWPTGTTCPS